MTQEEILEYNKKCAEFLGKEINVFLCTPTLTHYQFGHSMLLTKDMKFHSDWNWIMEVVEAIEKLRLNFKIGLYWVTIEPIPQSEIDWKPLNIPHSQVNSDLNKKEAVVQAINQFLIWYNKEK